MSATHVAPLADGATAQHEADAAARVLEHSAQRVANVSQLEEEGGIARVDDQERIAKRLDRLNRYYGGERLPRSPADTPDTAPEVVIARAVERAATPVTAGAVSAEASPAPAVVLEKIINNPDFIDIRYLERGVAAARAVCRIQIRNAAGRVLGHGTGSLVSPQLVLTNHHVLGTPDDARNSAAEFDYQDGLDGQPLTSRVFTLDPDTFFLADRERDFALCAVGAGPVPLSEFGFNPLIEAEGKAIIGEFVTIVQHPRGEKKQVVLRENKIVDLPGAFMHYSADTEPGSSGSPVFNDQWEVVALHHASVGVPGRAEFGGFVNEGIRVSRVLAFVYDQQFSPAQRALLDAMRSDRESIVVPAAVALTTSAPVVVAAPVVRDATTTLPLEITVRIAGPERPSQPEKIAIDPDYANRRGYDPDFLGTGSLSVAMPRVVSDPQASPLPYHHFSVVMNTGRRLAWFTAVNIDGARSRRIRRDPDRWVLDPRIPSDAQTGEAVYIGNDLDRGHLVRRLDPAWGATEEEVKQANDDTFHFTNCTPQHKGFNQRQTSWAGLEDYVLENAENRDLRVCVFCGPVLASNDDQYRGVQLPRQFWKVVAMVTAAGRLSATGYLLSQESLLEGLERAEDFSYGAYRTFQVPITRLEALTALDFGALKDSDPLARLEATTRPREVLGPEDLTL